MLILQGAYRSTKWITDHWTVKNECAFWDGNCFGELYGVLFGFVFLLFSLPSHSLMEQTENIHGPLLFHENDIL